IKITAWPGIMLKKVSVEGAVENCVTKYHKYQWQGSASRLLKYFRLKAKSIGSNFAFLWKWSYSSIG
ncbi:MAG TPA: hypothetical protein VHY59_05250, partial [Chthoniobacterales bacterium]|nr:hypothetical protein [Chthoniobacterales bacterium]